MKIKILYAKLANNINKFVCAADILYMIKANVKRPQSQNRTSSDYFKKFCNNVNGYVFKNK